MHYEGCFKHHTGVGKPLSSGVNTSSATPHGDRCRKSHRALGRASDRRREAVAAETAAEVSNASHARESPAASSSRGCSRPGDPRTPQRYVFPRFAD